jgi:polysaccharide biosynthesis/export protein
MPTAPQSLQRLTALVLTSLYSLTTALPTALLLWILQSGAWAPTTLAQTVDPSDPSLEPQGTSTQPTNNEALLEEARQRLLNRGESLEAAPSEPSIPLTSSDTQFDRYRLGAGDSIFISVKRFNDLNFQATLDLEGNIIVPLAGALNLRGLTLPAARAQIQSALNRYIVDPEVDLTLVVQRPVEVSVLGEVGRPGVYSLPAPELAVALVSAGGTTRLADLRSVRIRRTRADGFVEERNVDLFTPLRDSTALPDIRLEDGDAIVIPTLTVEASEEYNRSLVARSTLAQPQITIRVLSYASGANEQGGGGGQISSIVLPNGSDFIDVLTAIAPNPDVANLREIALVRFDPEQGRAVTQEIDARQALRGEMSQNPPLEDNDVIVVGRNFISRITYALNRFTQPFRDVLGFLLFFDTLAEGADNLFRPTGEDDNGD